MRLFEIASGSTVFIDANILLAVILEEENGSSAEHFLKRVENQQINGVTSVVVINEIFHRLLVAETCEFLSVSPMDALKRLKHEPKIFESLQKSWQIINDILKPDFDRK